MLKQLIAILLFSIFVIVSMPQAHVVLNAVVEGHNWVSELLTQVFAGGQTGLLIKNLFALVAIPLGIAAIPGLIYWLVRRQWFPYFIEIVWAIWLMQAAALVILYKAVA